MDTYFFSPDSVWNHITSLSGMQYVTLLTLSQWKYASIVGFQRTSCPSRAVQKASRMPSVASGFWSKKSGSLWDHMMIWKEPHISLFHQFYFTHIVADEYANHDTSSTSTEPHPLIDLPLVSEPGFWWCWRQIPLKTNFILKNVSGMVWTARHGASTEIWHPVLAPCDSSSPQSSASAYGSACASSGRSAALGCVDSITWSSESLLATKTKFSENEVLWIICPPP